MVYLPWLPQPENTHTGRLLAVARCIHQKYYREERHHLYGPVRTFNSLGAGPLELVSAVLQRAGFTEYLDGIPDRSVFTCLPDEFEAVAVSEKAQAVEPDLVVKAVLRLGEEGFEATEEIAWLTGRLRSEC
ncbi:MAG: hypothetical protein HWE35_12195 [Rhodobacteraceae bacterium]|nr:hypothetical protein [Paracoccaceae bacterium]